MDKNTLVSSGHALIRALEAEGAKPRLAMWVHKSDMGTWKLWLVPPRNIHDKRDFYRRVSRAISKNRQEMGGIDASDTEMVEDSHPAVRGMSRFLRMEQLGSASFSGNTFNGFYLPDGIVLLSNL